MSRELGRRLARSSSAAAADEWARVLASNNPASLRAASSAAAGVPRAAPLVAAMVRRVADRPGDVALRLDLSALLRHAGELERAASSLVGVAGVSAGNVRPLLREALALGDREYVRAVLRDATALDDQARAGLRGATAVADRLVGDDVAALARESAADSHLLAALVTWACHLGLPAMRRLASELEGLDIDPASSAYLATRMREAGDLRLSTELAESVLDRQSGNLAMRRLAAVGRSSLETLVSGWTPPPQSQAPSGVAPHRVDYLLHSSLPDTSLGYAIRTQGLLAALGDLGWDVRGITQPGYPEDREADAREVVDGVEYWRLQAGGPLPHWPVEEMVAEYLSRLEPLLASDRPGIVHAASNFRNGLAAVAAARRAGLPVVYEVRGLWQHTRAVREPEFAGTEMFALMERLEIEAARLADRVIVITEALGRYLVARGVPPESVVVVPNGVDTSRFVPRERDHDLAHELGLRDRTVIGYVGGMVEYEGLNLLVDAVRQLSTERDDFAVLLVGDGRSAPGLRAAVREQGLMDVVTFTGRVPHEQVERYYSLVDIAPFPRLPVDVAELVSPLKPLEAMAMGKAVIVSDVSAMAEMVDDARTGLVFAKGSADGLAGALRRVLDDGELRESIAQGGLDWVRRSRDWHQVAGRLSEVWAQLLAEHHGVTPAHIFDRGGAHRRPTEEHT